VGESKTGESQKLEKVRQMIKAAIADEERLQEDFHRGRVSAFKRVLDVIGDKERGERPQ